MEVLVFFGIVTAIVILAVKSNQNPWVKAARLLMLHHRAGRIEGTLPTGPVTVFKFRRPGGKGIFTSYKASCIPPLGIGIHLVERKFLDRLGKLKGLQEVRLGDEAFDDRVAMKGHDAGKIREFLTPAKRKRILAALDRFPGLKIDDVGVHWDERGVQKDPNRLAETVSRLSSLCLWLSGKEMEQEKDRERPETAGGRVPLEIEPSETAVPAAAHRTAHQPPARVGSPRPADPRPPEKSSPAREAAVPVAEIARPDRPPAPGPLPEPDRSPPPSSEPELVQVCESLFGPGRSTIEAGRRFEADCKGRKVRWPGVLRGADAYSFEWVFEGGPGTKAILEVHETRDIFGASKVYVAVQLPPGGVEALRARTGERCVVEGRLWAFDPLQRTIFIRDGKIEARP